VPNGVEYEHFARARKEPRTDPPPDLAPVVARGRPIVGYHGALARWFDYDLVAEVARRRPDLSFVLIGPDFDFTLRETSLLSLPNVTWLESRPYADLPDYLAWVDVGIIPFRPSAVTHATSPIKLFEYMAAGIPPVITPMDESMRHPQATVADTPEAWSSALDRALARGKDKAFRAEIDRVARMNTWEMRAEKVLTALEQRAMKARAFGQAGDHHD
jgi:glycosyltransferase involved in cell wall biosynthesis